MTETIIRVVILCEGSNLSNFNEHTVLQLRTKEPEITCGSSLPEFKHKKEVYRQQKKENAYLTRKSRTNNRYNRKGR